MAGSADVEVERDLESCLEKVDGSLDRVEKEEG